MSLYTGLELEMHLIDRDGNIINEADTVLDDNRNSGNLISELSKSMVEVISPPSDKLSKLHELFLKELITLNEICDSHGFGLVPSSTIGPDVTIVSNDYKKIMGMRKREILGEYKRNLEHHICGIHVHTDKLDTEKKAFSQYLVIQAMDPLFALMASTPFLLGHNTKNDYRVDTYRNHVFEDFPLQGQLLDYPVSYQDILSRQEKTYHIWMSKGKVLPTDGFTMDNILSGPIRLRSKTIESRCADSNLFSRLMALAATYKGVSEYLQVNDPIIVIDENGEFKDNYFKPVDGKLFIPPFSFLKHAEGSGVANGIADPILRNYLSNIVKLAKSNLDEPEYLRPFEQSLKSGENFSDDIIRFAHRKNLEYNGKINENTASEIRKYIANRYQKDLSEMRL